MTKGYLTFAQNNDTTDYLNLAYLQALSIKVTQKENQYAVVVDDATMNSVTDRHRAVFDYIIPIPGVDDAANDSWKLRNEWKAYQATPFDETIKLEADMLFTSNLDHWWDILKLKDLCFTTGVLDYTGNVATSRAYRKAFDDNNLLNLYNGFYYFKRSPIAEQFFYYAELLFKNWDMIKSDVLKDCGNEPASTDLVFAVAAKIVGDENCYLPGMVPTFAHMKGAINNWSIDDDWRNFLYYQFDSTTFTAGFTRQRVPYHYHYKDFVTEEIIKHYEDEYERTSGV